MKNLRSAILNALPYWPYALVFAAVFIPGVTMIFGTAVTIVNDIREQRSDPPADIAEMTTTDPDIHRWEVVPPQDPEALRPTRDYSFRCADTRNGQRPGAEGPIGDGSIVADIIYTDTVGAPEEGAPFELTADWIGSTISMSPDAACRVVATEQTVAATLEALRNLRADDRVQVALPDGRLVDPDGVARGFLAEVATGGFQVFSDGQIDDDEEAMLRDNIARGQAGSKHWLVVHGSQTVEAEARLAEWGLEGVVQIAVTR